MIPVLYESVTAGTVPSNNGLGLLSDCIEGTCKVEIKRNDIYELTFDYPITGIHAEEIAYRRIVKAKPNPTDNPQLFRIERIGKAMNGKFTVYARHISYDLSGFEILTGTASTAAAACTLLQNAANGFTITTDKTTTGSFKIDTPSSVKSYFVGRSGSFLDVFGTADIKYDNYTVNFKAHGGEDRGVTIRYGKNLLELSQEIGSGNLYSHVRCYYKNGDTDAVYGDKVATGLTLDVEKCLLVDVTQEYMSAPTTAQLKTRAQRYVSENNLTTPTNNITLDFVQSGELSERVDLFDTVSVYYEALGITRTQVKCIRTVFDVIKEKYIVTEFGDHVSSVTDTIVSGTKEVKTQATFLESAVKHATELITGNLGGYVILHDSNGDGEPDEILIMNTADISTATQVWRWNKNGLGFATSYAGSYGTAITQDGKIVADYVATGTLDASKITVQHLSASSIDTGVMNADLITAGTLNANLIKAGVISDVAGNSSIDMTNGAATMKDFKSKSSFRLVNSSGTTKGYLYISSSGTYLSLYAANNNYELVNISADDSSSSGILRLKNKNGTVCVYAAASTSTGGHVIVYNSDADQVAGFDTGRGANKCGIMFVNNDQATTTIYGDGQSGNLRCVSLTQTSSRKVKDNIKPITDAQKILDLQAVSFDYKDKAQGTDKRGFIAEDVEKVLPNLVKPAVTEGDAKRPASLDYIGMIPYLQAVIKDQESRIQELERRLAALENKQA